MGPCLSICTKYERECHYFTGDSPPMPKEKKNRMELSWNTAKNNSILETDICHG